VTTSVRRMTLDDIGVVIPLMRRNFQESPAARETNVDEFKALWFILHTIKNENAFVAFSEAPRVLVGVAGGVVKSEWWTEDREFVQCFLYVVPEGRRSHAGSLLLDALKDRARCLRLPFRMDAVFGGLDMETKDRWFRVHGLEQIGGIFRAGRGRDCSTV